MDVNNCKRKMLEARKLESLEAYYVLRLSSIPASQLPGYCSPITEGVKQHLVYMNVDY